MPPPSTRTEKLDLRITPAVKRTPAVAAVADNRWLSEFVLDSALTRAEETLALRGISGSTPRNGGRSWRPWMPIRGPARRREAFQHAQPL